MRKADFVYGATMNLFGTPTAGEPPAIQACLDREREAALRSHHVRRLVRWLRHFGGAR